MFLEVPINDINCENISNKTKEFESLEKAIINKNIINFEYNQKQRTANPYNLYNNNGVWYLVAYETKIKTYTFSKIKNLKITEEVFDIDTKVSEEIKEYQNNWCSKNQIEIVIKIEKEVSHYFKRRDLLPNQKIEKELADGGLIISCKTSFEKEVLSIIRYWIPNIQVISPDDTKQKLEDSLKDYLKVN